MHTASLPPDGPHGNPRRALVTGAAGFTGRYVVAELLRHGWQVWAMRQTAPDRVQPPADSAPATPRPIQADLLDADSLRAAVQQVQPHAVVHLAAVAFVAHGSAEDFYRTNIAGTRNLLAALAALPVVPQQVLLASSANVYGSAAAGRLDEHTALNPANDYAVSKAAMEMMARLWQERLPIIITRPFNYTGVGQAENYLVPKIVAHFRKRAPVIELGNLDVWRDFSDVRQVAAIYRRLLDAMSQTSRPGGTEDGNIFNIGSQQAHSLREILQMATEITGHQLEVRVNPAFVRANEVKTLCADTSRLRAVLAGDAPPPITLRDTLAWMLNA